MSRSLATALVLLLVAVASPAHAYFIIFEVTVHGYAPQIDFDAVQVRIMRSDGSDVRLVRSPVFESTPVDTGFHLYLFEVDGGDWDGVVSLLDSGGAPMDELGFSIDNLDRNTGVGGLNIVRPRLDATKTWELLVDHEGDGVPTPGDVVRYTVEVSNRTHLPTEGTSYIDEVAAEQNLTLVIGSVTTSQGTVARGNGGPSETVVVLLGDMAHGESATIGYDAVVGASGALNQGEVLAFNVSGFSRTDDPSTDPILDPTRVPISLAGIEAVRSDLGDALDRVDECEDTLAAAETELADPDEDGVPAVSDECGNTFPGEAVDAQGCSLPQFCAAIETSGRRGRVRCSRADWRNDEPIGRGDCRHRRGRCVPR